MLFDLDFGMSLLIHDTLDFNEDIVQFNMIDHVMQDERRMSLFKNLMENEEAREKFITIMLTLLNDNFETNNVKQKIDELAGQIRPEIERSINRWENIESIEQWEKNIQDLHDFAEKRPQIVKDHLKQAFNLTDSEIKSIENSILINH